MAEIDQAFIDGFLPFQVRVLYLKIRQLFHQAHDDGDVVKSNVGFGILLAVAAHPGSSQREVADCVGVPASIAVRTMKGLIERGLVARTADPRDRRNYRLSLTADGDAYLDANLPRAAANERIMMDGLTEAEKAAFLAALHKIQRNIDRYLAATTGSPQA